MTVEEPPVAVRLQTQVRHWHSRQTHGEIKAEEWPSLALPRDVTALQVSTLQNQGPHVTT